MIEPDLEDDCASCSIVRQKVSTLSEDLARLCIPEEVKQEAEKIYELLGKPIHRNNKRKHMIYYLVSNAFDSLRKVFWPPKLAYEIGIRKEEIGSAASLFKGKTKNFRAPVINYRPTRYLPLLADILGYDDPNFIEGLSEFGNQLLEKNPRLGENFPQNMAAGIVHRYMMNEGYNGKDKEEFPAKLLLSWNLIRNASEEVSILWNS